MITGAGEPSQQARNRDLGLVLIVWTILVLGMFFLERQNLEVPGLYYDEAVFAGMAKDFVIGQVHGQHMPDHQIVMLAGRPFGASGKSDDDGTIVCFFSRNKSRNDCRIWAEVMMSILVSQGLADFQMEMMELVISISERSVLADSL